jgi:hypothetical protein
MRSTLQDRDPNLPRGAQQARGDPLTPTSRPDGLPLREARYAQRRARARFLVNSGAEPDLRPCRDEFFRSEQSVSAGIQEHKEQGN